jgi:hypothetical protein
MSLIWFFTPFVSARFDFSGKAPLHEYAPYAAFVLTIEKFFHIALKKAGLIFPDRASTRTDIANLFYLPLCTTFVSSDRCTGEPARFSCGRIRNLCGASRQSFMRSFNRRDE